jgi:hypothetical protein
MQSNEVGLLQIMRLDAEPKLSNEWERDERMTRVSLELGD